MTAIDIVRGAFEAAGRSVTTENDQLIVDNDAVVVVPHVTNMDDVHAFLVALDHPRGHVAAVRDDIVYIYTLRDGSIVDAGRFDLPRRRQRKGRPPTPRPLNQWGHVYLLHAPTAGLVKIGIAKDPDLRAAQIRTISPVPVEIVAVSKKPVSPHEETRLHREFGNRRSHGEWFKDSVLSRAVPIVEAL